jgi:hypothetical protein
MENLVVADGILGSIQGVPFWDRGEIQFRVREINLVRNTGHLIALLS